MGIILSYWEYFNWNFQEIHVRRILRILFNNLLIPETSWEFLWGFKDFSPKIIDFSPVVHFLKSFLAKNHFLDSEEEGIVKKTFLRTSVKNLKIFLTANIRTQKLSYFDADLPAKNCEFLKDCLKKYRMIFKRFFSAIATSKARLTVFY